LKVGQGRQRSKVGIAKTSFLRHHFRQALDSANPLKGAQVEILGRLDIKVLEL